MLGRGMSGRRSSAIKDMPCRSDAWKPWQIASPRAHVPIPRPLPLFLLSSAIFSRTLALQTDVWTMLLTRHANGLVFFFRFQNPGLRGRKKPKRGFEGYLKPGNKSDSFPLRYIERDFRFIKEESLAYIWENTTSVWILQMENPRKVYIGNKLFRHK